MKTLRVAYQDKWVTLYEGNAMELLELLPMDPRALGLFDCVITDPPYGELSCAWDKWPDGWPGLAGGVANSLWCFGSVRLFMDKCRDFAGWQLSQDVVWEKHNGSSFARDRFRRVHEQVAHFYTGDWRMVYRSPVTIEVPETRRRKGSIVRGQKPGHWNGIERRSTYTYDGQRMARSVLKIRSCHGHAVHPTQKPEGIIAPLIEYSCPPGGRILDPFAGSATTLVVARRMGRRAVGIESDPAIIKEAVARLTAPVAQEAAA